MLFDLKLAWRRLRNAPLFTSTAIATLALAIGANTAIFSIADAVLFRRPVDLTVSVNQSGRIDRPASGPRW